MNKLLWLVGGGALAVAVYAILNDSQNVPVNGVDRAAGQLGAWGTKQRVTGAGGDLLGRVKQAAGNLTGDQDTASEGALDQATGAVKNAAGQAAQALGSTLHDLNK